MTASVWAADGASTVVLRPEQIGFRLRFFDYYYRVPNENLTKEERAAIRDLLRAKSDREIARLLRQSHRLLRLHRRKPSNWLHRERWQEWELKLLGRMRDEELAPKLSRSTAAVAAKRESLDIRIFQSQRNFWTPREIALLGKAKDEALAKRLNRSRYSVQQKRTSLGITALRDDWQAWTSREDSLLGKMSDAKLATRLHRTISSVRSRRLEHTSFRFHRSPKKWTTGELKLLGKMSDGELGRRTDRLLSAVRNKRLKLGIPKFLQSKSAA